MYSFPIPIRLTCDQGVFPATLICTHGKKLWINTASVDQLPISLLSSASSPNHAVFASCEDHPGENTGNQQHGNPFKPLLGGTPGAIPISALDDFVTRTPIFAPSGIDIIGRKIKVKIDKMIQRPAGKF